MTISNILVTGGFGYIGSHATSELISLGYNVVVFDNFSNCERIAVERLVSVTGADIAFVEGDLCIMSDIQAALLKYKPDAVLHFAGLKSVSDSVHDPATYFKVNISGTINLIKAMELSECDNLIFSSSATVYGDSNTAPFNEQHQISPTNPYGTSKSLCELLLKDWAQARKTRRVVSLRYFNPVGAHKSGNIGESPIGKPANLMPILLQVAGNEVQDLEIFGDDYPTPDGTAVRDYIHVLDLVSGHISALQKLEKLDAYNVYNLGTGAGASVFELKNCLEKVSGREIPYILSKRRAGDVAVSYADVSKAERQLGFKCKYGIEDMCIDSWNWYCSMKKGN